MLRFTGSVLFVSNFCGYTIDVVSMFKLTSCSCLNFRQLSMQDLLESLIVINVIGIEETIEI